MVLPTEYRAFRRTTGELPHAITPSQETLPERLGPNDVLIKIHAVSLNYRDVAMLNGKYPVKVIDRGVPASDCAAEVVGTGSAVRGFEKGDHVAPIFDINNLSGQDDASMKALGGDVDGVLREYAVFNEEVLVQLPKYLSWEEASTITCAGVTAWNALDLPGVMTHGRSAFLQGTGGVSMFALLLCHAAGLTPIITSSSDEKLESIKKLSSEARGINYKQHPDQVSEVTRITEGKGVDVVVNNTGVGSLITDIGSLRQRGGVVSLVGFLDGFKADWDPSALMAMMGKAARLKGIAVGSKLDYQALSKFLEEKEVRLDPLIDRTFSFDESSQAFDYLYSGKHVGKVIIKL
ncbi:hypothetical protein LTR56_012866 [Elasticomyces elasticus]|nr:hypothetical protein LTR56_012866 [Elasticomyces elasticus]KAK3650792.1 hypothetical protein LTR22_012391 [Elasticomyces elasticus]KAK4918496.1 hypothetical protein LTR49_013729 [Elasticomyces elasticus]KAK5757866.1 hypothetical protein LTS12_012050 [Elasticomyces elasticus]